MAVVGLERKTYILYFEYSLNRSKRKKHAFREIFSLYKSFLKDFCPRDVYIEKDNKKNKKKKKRINK